MKLTNRQLLLGALKPLLFCVGMYCVVLVSSVFVCSSIYHAVNTPKKQVNTQSSTTASLRQVNNDISHAN